MVSLGYWLSVDLATSTHENLAATSMQPYHPRPLELYLISGEGVYNLKYYFVPSNKHTVEVYMG